MRVPSRHISGKLFQHGERAFAPAIKDGARNVSAARGHNFRNGIVTNQIADVRHNPVGAGFNKKVIP